MSIQAELEVNLLDKPPLLDRLLRQYDTLPARAPGPLSTEPVKRVLAALGHPEKRIPPVVHVAGTNGKGSTVAFLRSIAEAHGLRVHVDTSPHLIRVNERVRIAGELIGDDLLEELTTKVVEASAGHSLSFFEGMTAVAIAAFAEIPADLAIFEVGLGGRFDSTNVVDNPAVSVITPIDFDHMKFLGDKLEQIAWEKAGIIKKDCPAVFAPQRPEALSVLNAEADEVGAHVHYLPEEIRWSGTDSAFCFTADYLTLNEAGLALKGPHQCSNAALALHALAICGLVPFNEAAVRAGLKAARWPARMQELQTGMLKSSVPDQRLVIDGGHNPHAARAIIEEYRHKGPLTMICGLLAGKDLSNYLKPIAELDLRLIAIPMPDGHEGHAPEEIVEAATALGINAIMESNAETALSRAKEYRTPEILICGSLYLAGHILKENGDQID